MASNKGLNETAREMQEAYDSARKTLCVIYKPLVGSPCYAPDHFPFFPAALTDAEGRCPVCGAILLQTTTEPLDRDSQ